MAINSRMASAVHILCVVAWFPEEGTNSDAIARSLKTNPVVVRRLLKSMEKEGLVKVRRGRNGGVELARDPQDITLDEVYRAVESEDSIFSLRDTVNERCPVARGVQSLLPPVFAAANSAVEAALNRTTLASLMTSIG